MLLSFMSFSCPELGLADLLHTAHSYGYQAVEPRIQAGHGHGLELDCPAAVRNEAVRLTDEIGVGFSCIATSCTFADPVKREAMIRDADAAIDLASDVGAPVIRVFGGELPEGLGRDEAIKGLAEALKRVADHAADSGVIVCLETHDDWCDPAHVAAVLSAVDHGAVAANWDLMHPVRRGGVTMDRAFEILQPWIAHVHFHDGIAKPDGGTDLVPVGTGIIDHKRAVELLIGMDYEGYLSGEWIKWEPYDVHLPREMSVMRDYIDENLIKEE